MSIEQRFEQVLQCLRIAKELYCDGDRNASTYELIGVEGLLADLCEEIENDSK